MADNLGPNGLVVFAGKLSPQWRQKIANAENNEG